MTLTSHMMQIRWRVETKHRKVFLPAQLLLHHLSNRHATAVAAAVKIITTVPAMRITAALMPVDSEPAKSCNHKITTASSILVQPRLLNVT
jgi:hypothetical protein